MRDPLASPPAERHPLVVYLLGLCGYAGVIGLIFPPGQGLPVWLTSLWASALVVGAAVTLAGVFWRSRVTGLLLERMGLRWFAVIALVYAAPLLAAAHTTVDRLGAVPLLGFAVAAYYRSRQIKGRLDELHAVLDLMDWARRHRDEP